MTNTEKTKRNVGRIDHVIFAYRTFERAEQTREKMTALLGLDPDAWMKPADLDPPFNLRTSVCWEAGLEIISPLEGFEDNWFGTQIIAERGEGVCAVVFGVDDIDEACRRAEGLGLPILQTMHDSRFPDGPDSVHAGLPFTFGDTIEACHKRLREALVSPFNGTGLAFGEFEPLDPGR
jgi:hypothetical protein